MRQTNYFLQTLEHLRHYEEVLLFTDLLLFSDEHQREVVQYLAKQYQHEIAGYPFIAPEFNPDAALWGAKTVYLASQLLLYREHKEAELDKLFPAYQQEIDTSAILSADLLLRFLPDVILQLKAIDPDDALIGLLETHLKTWHYSGIRYPLPVEELDLRILKDSDCLSQLYIDRVIFYRNLSLAKRDGIKERINATLGNYASHLWNEFKQELTIENERN